MPVTEKLGTSLFVTPFAPHDHYGANASTVAVLPYPVMPGVSSPNGGRAAPTHMEKRSTLEVTHGEEYNSGMRARLLVKGGDNDP